MVMGVGGGIKMADRRNDDWCTSVRGGLCMVSFMNRRKIN